ncbi:MAG TPA: pseudouridine synthase [Acidimicrobiia bacterium]|jgi:pseudouridine synthase|nr:pseudouridine synthase [Acidimicrobiia bacterium]
MTERVHKVIANSGFASRRRAEQLIAAGRVTVDGVTASIGQKVDPAEVAIEIDAIPLPVRPELRYELLNKPVGVVSTADDPSGRPTVVELIGGDDRLYPVGRLDIDSEGLLLLTNDGELTLRLTHPRYGVTKTYSVLVTGSVPDGVARRLTSGVELEDGPAAAVTARVVDRRPDRSLLEVVMGEGRKREVRRMLEAVGHPVQRLVRTMIGPLRDSQLRPGEHRPLTLDEVRSLYSAAGTAWDDGASSPEQ